MQGKNNEVKKNTFEHLAPSGRGWHVVPSEGVLNKEHFMGTPSSPLRGTSKAEMLFDNPPTPPYGGTFPTRGAEKAALCAKHPARGEVHGGFTLIELLVVVLIIAILAAVAVPQYKKAVEKSRVIQGITLIKSLYDSSVIYYLANGTWPSSINELDLNFADTNTLKLWDILLSEHEAPSDRGFNRVTRVLYKSGPYAGAGFIMYHSRDSNYANKEEQKKIMCYECKKSTCPFKFNGEKGDFCSKIMSARFLDGSDGNYSFRLN